MKKRKHEVINSFFFSSKALSIVSREGNTKSGSCLLLLRERVQEGLGEARQRGRDEGPDGQQWLVITRPFVPSKVLG